MKKILLLLANGFEVYEASVFIDVFGWSFLEGAKNTVLKSCALRREIKSSFGLTVRPDLLVKNVDVNRFDALAIPGGFENYGFYKDAYDERFLALIRAFHRKRKPIASICVGALSIARCGLLTGKRATTYKGRRQAQLKAFGAKVVNRPIVVQDNIITSWNPSTAIPVALLLLAKLTSRQNARQVKKLMGF